MMEILIQYHGQHRKIAQATIHQITDTFGGQRLDDKYPSTTYPTGQERGPDTTGSSDWEQFLAMLSIHSGPLADAASQVLCIWSSQPPPAYIPHPMGSPHQHSKQEQLEDILQQLLFATWDNQTDHEEAKVEQQQPTVNPVMTQAIPQHSLSKSAFYINMSNHNARRWLEAILRQLQNMAWDRWQYRNGIDHPLCSFTRTTPGWSTKPHSRSRSSRSPCP